MKIDRHSPVRFSGIVKLGLIAMLRWLRSGCFGGNHALFGDWRHVSLEPDVLVSDRFLPLQNKYCTLEFWLPSPPNDRQLEFACHLGAERLGQTGWGRGKPEVIEELRATARQERLLSQSPTPLAVRFFVLLSIFGATCAVPESFAQQTLDLPPATNIAAELPPVAELPPADALTATKSTDDKPVSQPKAVALLQHTINRLANGPAFNASVRQRVWAFGREVLGIGTYEQAGYGSGRFNLQLTMLDGAGKHTVQQISDGRLAWTRTMIADQVALRRVDVGRLDEWIPADRVALRTSPAVRDGAGDGQAAADNQIPPRLKVGAWTELLDTIQRDHVLKLGSSKIDNRPVLVITGSLRKDVRNKVMSAAGQTWPEMYPTTVKVAIAATPDPETGFGEGLPVRFEFWALPKAVESRKQTETARPERLVTLIELYALHAMSAPPVQRFRFENQDSDVNFVNETDRYMQRYGVRITDNQRRLLMR